MLPPTPIADSGRAQIVDEFGELDRLVSAFSPTQKRYKALQDQIRSWYVNFPVDQATAAEGGLYRVLVGARGEERSFSLKAKAKIFAKLGKAAAIAAFSITLKAVEEALGKDELDALATKAPTGSRKLVAVAKAPAARTKAA